MKNQKNGLFENGKLASRVGFNGITRERNLELIEIAKLPTNSPFNREMHDLAVKINAGKANRREKGKFNKWAKEREDTPMPPPVILNSELEVERLNFHRVRLAGLAAGEQIMRLERELELMQLEKDAADEYRANLDRESLVTPVSAIPGGLRESWQKLTPDERQLLNLWMRVTFGKGRFTWPKVAQQYRQQGKGGHLYTGERCKQKFRAIHKKHQLLATDLKVYFASRRDLLRRDAEEVEENDGDFIQKITTELPRDKSSKPVKRVNLDK